MEYKELLEKKSLLRIKDILGEDEDIQFLFKSTLLLCDNDVHIELVHKYSFDNLEHCDLIFPDPKKLNLLSEYLNREGTDAFSINGNLHSYPLLAEYKKEAVISRIIFLNHRKIPYDMFKNFYSNYLNPFQIRCNIVDENESSIFRGDYNIFVSIPTPSEAFIYLYDISM